MSILQRVAVLSKCCRVAERIWEGRCALGYSLLILLEFRMLPDRI